MPPKVKVEWVVLSLGKVQNYDKPLLRYLNCVICLVAYDALMMVGSVVPLYHVPAVVPEIYFFSCYAIFISRMDITHTHFDLK